MPSADDVSDTPHKVVPVRAVRLVQPPWLEFCESSIYLASVVFIPSILELSEIELATKHTVTILTPCKFLAHVGPT
jgi:hypothetical protein